MSKLRSVWFRMRFLLFAAMTLALPCPSPLSQGPWLGGVCTLQPSTQLSDQPNVPLTLDFNGTTVDCQGQHVEPYYFQGDMRLSRGQFRNCNDNIGALALTCYGGITNVSFSDMSFVNCSSSAFYLDGNTHLNITNCHFEECWRGAVHVEMALSFYSVNCTFINCTSRYRGGAIYLVDPNAELATNLIQSCTFINIIYGAGDAS